MALFRAKFVNADLFKKVISGVKDLLVEVNILCGRSGVSMQAMDGSHVSLVDFRLNRKAFVGETCFVEDARKQAGVPVGISMKTLADIAGCIDKKDSLTLEATDTELCLESENAKQSRLAKFRLPTMDIDSEHMSIPDLGYRASARVLASEFKRVVDSMMMLGDTMIVTFSVVGLEFRAVGAATENVNQARVLMQATQEEDPTADNVVIKIEDDKHQEGAKTVVTVQLATRYMRHFAKAAGASEFVTIRASRDAPVLVQYDLLDDEKTNVGWLKFHLAPKITENDHDAAAEQQDQDQDHDDNDEGHEHDE